MAAGGGWRVAGGGWEVVGESNSWKEFTNRLFCCFKSRWVGGWVGGVEGGSKEEENGARVD